MVDITPTEYRVGTLDDAQRGIALFIKLRIGGSGEERFAITKSDHSREVLNRSGEWEWEPRPSERSDEFIQNTRFDLTEAMIVATNKYYDM